MLEKAHELPERMTRQNRSLPLFGPLYFTLHLQAEIRYWQCLTTISIANRTYVATYLEGTKVV